MQYVKFGSKWGKKGSSLLNIFNEYNIVFAGFYDKKTSWENAVKKAQNKLCLVKKGTRVVVSVGKNVKYIGIAEENATTLDKLLQEYKEDDKDYIKGYLNYIDNTILAVKVKLYELDKKDCFDYGSRGRRFCKVLNNNKIKLIDELLEKYSN